MALQLERRVTIVSVRSILRYESTLPSGPCHTDAAIAPGAPTSLTATPDGRTAIDLSWAAPSNNGGATITGYKIEVSTNTGTSWTDLVANTGGTGTTYTHSSLAAGTTRHYRVSAINSAGTGNPSNVANATTSTVTAPGAPTSLSAAPDGRTAIDLSWTAPSITVGQPSRDTRLRYPRTQVHLGRIW